MGRANRQADRAGAVDRPIAERFRDGRRLKVGQGIETWLAVDEDGREVVVRAAPLRAVGAAARKWLEIEIELLNQLPAPSADGDGTSRAGRLTLGVEGDSLFLVRPFVTGMTLKERLARQALSIDEVIGLGAQLARALEEAHARGVVHGDLKPSNVVLGDGGPVVIDFGLARHAFLGDGRDRLAVDGVRYLAPEQSGLLERGVDARADLYSLGVMLHEAVVGRPPFEGRDVAELLHRQLIGAPPPLPAPAPRALDRVVARLLRIDARDRYQTARGVRADLEDLAAARAANDLDPDVVIGARDSRDSLTEPAFTGRREELAALERAVDRARDDRGGLVLLEGESGAGKTWLLEELSRRIGLRPVWLLRGHGAAHVPPRPFQLVARVAREIAAGAPPGSGRAARIAAGVAGVERAIAASLPALAALVGDDGAAATGAAEPAALPDPKAEDRTLYALSALLDSLGSREEPAVLLFDDAQWADAQTLRLLERWSGQGRALPHVVVVLAFRSEEVAEGHALRKLGGAEQVRIPRFGPAEVREQIASMAGRLPERVVELVLEHAAGNPFLVSAALQGLVESSALAASPDGWRVTEDALAELRVSGWLADLLVGRIARLPEPARRVLEVGALLGRTFDPALAAELAGVDAGGALRAVQDLRGRLLWVAAAGTGCTFPHDKIREVLLARLDDEERRRLHREAARLLDDGTGGREFDLAYHLDAAGEPRQALPHALRAAERARDQHDMELAERFYRVAARGAADERDAALRFRIALGLGDVLLVRSRYDDCAAELDAACGLAPDDAARAAVEERRTQLELKRGRLGDAAEHGERALRLIGRRVPRSRVGCALLMLWQLLVQVLHTRLPRLFVARRPTDRADDDLAAVRIYHSLSSPYFFARGAVWALWAHLTEMNLAERYPPTAALGRTYGLHGAMCSGAPVFFERAIRYTRRGAALCAERGDVWGHARAVQFLSLGLCSTGQYQEAVEAADESARLFERAGDEWEANGPRNWGALARYRMGDLAGARAAALDLLARGRMLDDAHGIAFGFDVWARASEGRVPADDLRDELARRAEHVQTSSALAQAEAIRLLAQGQPAEAAALVDTWLDRLRAEGAFLHESNVSLLAYRVTALRRQIEELPPTDPARRASLLARARRASARALKMTRKFKNSEPHALREAAILAAMAGQPDRAIELADLSVAAADRLGARFEHALSREVRGQLGVTLERAGARAELDAARADLGELRASLAEASSRPPVTISLIERFRAIVEAGQRIARALEPAAVYAAVLEGARALLPAQHGSIVEPGQPPERAAQDGRSPDRAAEPVAAPQVVVGDADPVSEALVREALAARRAVVRPTEELPIAADPVLARAAVRSALCAPICARGEPVALLYLTSGDVRDAFGEEAQQIAEFLTALGGAALENAEGLRRTQEFSRVLEDRVAERTAELEETQHQLLHAGRMAAVGTLIAGLSHELNNPLAVIAGNVDNLLRMTDDPDDPRRRPAEAIARHAGRAARLVDTLLRFSRNDPEPREQVSVNDLVRTIGDLIGAEARRRGVDLRVTVAERLPAIEVVRQEIESALVNIATNALQATPPGGSVEIVVSAQPRQGVPGVSFAVTDSGVGIDADSLPQIFDPFYTTKPAGQGTGLGLSLAREAVAAHRGAIEVDSAPGRGTTMRVWLPPESAEATTALNRARERAAPGPSGPRGSGS